MNSSDDKILVAIQCLVYNHEPYLRLCLDGFVIQKTNFRFVAIVHDDASTDSSASIIREYEERYPDIIKPIYETENQYSKHDGSIGRIINEACKEAKYIALCEGDDYWTDPFKLQKQVDFMEAHPDYSECFTNTIVKQPGEERMGINHIWDTYTIEDIIKSNALNTEERGDFVVPCGHTSSILYRRPENGLPDWISKCYIGDEPLFIALGQYGKAKFINEPMSVYRAGVGVSSLNYSCEADWKGRVAMYKFINEGLNYRYKKIINPIIAEFCFRIGKLFWKNGRKKEAMKYLFESLKYNKKIVIKWIKNKI